MKINVTRLDIGTILDALSQVAEQAERRQHEATDDFERGYQQVRIDELRRIRAGIMFDRDKHDNEAEYGRYRLDILVNDREVRTLYEAVQEAEHNEAKRTTIRASLNEKIRDCTKLKDQIKNFSR